MKLTRILLVLGLFASLPLIRAEDAPKTEKAPAAEKAGKKGGGRGPEQRIAQIDEAVGGLTDDQKAKIKEIYAKLADVPREEMRAKMQETRDAVRAVLTPEQQKKFDAMPQRGPGGGKKKAD